MGLSNDFYTKVGSDIFKIYKEEAMLGKTCCSKLLRLLNKPKNNILTSMSDPDKIKTFKQIVFSSILATDMA